MKELILLKDLGMQYAKPTSKTKRRYALYKCFCGNKFKACAYDVKNGDTKSCGCYQKTFHSSTTHGLTNSRIYKAWQNMKNRCYNKNVKKFERYGGRGIKVCNEWLNDFEAFYDWAMTNGYNDNLTIDRINNDGNYESSNCRWTTKAIQARNTRRLSCLNTSGYRGVNKNKKTGNWLVRITVNNKRISLGTYKCRLQGAYAYDNYIREKNLEHTLNFT